jgi:hypothetical protein
VRRPTPGDGPAMLAARRRLQDLLGHADTRIAVLLVALGLVISAQYWGGSINWSPDSLFYEAQKLEVQGKDRSRALNLVLHSSIAAMVKRENRRARSDEWIRYTSRFYRGRWTTPAAAAALDPVAGEHSLEVVSLLGYVVLGPLLYLLLRRRFDARVSAAATAACLVLPPVWKYAGSPLTDSWGLSLLVAGLLSATLARHRRLPWLALWMGVVLVLSFTREVTIVLLIAVGWLALHERSRSRIYLLATGLVAWLPALLLGSVPTKDGLAYVLSGFNIPADDSWGFILREYPHQLAAVARQDLTYPLHTAVPVLALAVGLIVFATLVFLFHRSAGGDPFVQLHRGAAIGGVVTILVSVNYTDLRLELVFVPAMAVGLALIIDRLLHRTGTELKRGGRLSTARWRASTQRHTPRPVSKSF